MAANLANFHLKTPFAGIPYHLTQGKCQELFQIFHKFPVMACRSSARHSCPWTAGDAAARKVKASFFRDGIKVVAGVGSGSLRYRLSLRRQEWPHSPCSASEQPQGVAAGPFTNDFGLSCKAFYGRHTGQKRHFGASVSRGGAAHQGIGAATCAPCSDKQPWRLPLARL